MATVVQGNATFDGSGGQTSFGFGFLSTPTSGNLLVLFYGARDDDDNETPTFTMPSGWTKVTETSPMEYHACGIAFRTSDGSESGTITVTTGAAVDSSWIGLVEFNESGVSSWQLDKTSNDGSGATNVSSIASGSTGTLGSSVGVAAIAGTSRTASEDLSTDTGASLAPEDNDFETDANRANFIAAWLSLTATTALDATISEASGSSRMGAAIATFIEADGGAALVKVESESEQVSESDLTSLAVVSSASLLATGAQTITDVVNENDNTTDLHLSVDDDPASPDDTDWVNNAVDVT